MDVPASVRIGPFTVSVGKLKKRSRSYGEFCEDSQQILLRERYANPPLGAESMLHELFHGVFFAAGLRPENEEQIVTAISPVFAQVIRDNPELIAWLQKSLAR